VAFYCILFLITLSDTSPFQHLNMQGKSVLPRMNAYSVWFSFLYTTVSSNNHRPTFSVSVEFAQENKVSLGKKKKKNLMV